MVSFWFLDKETSTPCNAHHLIRTVVFASSRHAHTAISHVGIRGKCTVKQAVFACCEDRCKRVPPRLTKTPYEALADNPCNAKSSLSHAPKNEKQAKLLYPFPRAWCVTATTNCSLFHTSLCTTPVISNLMTGRSISRLRLGTRRPPGVRGLATLTRPRRWGLAGSSSPLSDSES